MKLNSSVFEENSKTKIMPSPYKHERNQRFASNQMHGIKNFIDNNRYAIAALNNNKYPDPAKLIGDENFPSLMNKINSP